MLCVQLSCYSKYTVNLLVSCRVCLRVCIGTVSLLFWDYLQPGASKMKHIKAYMSRGEGLTGETPTWAVTGNVLEAHHCIV